MNLRNWFYIFAALIIPIILTSCIEENENLVNPPSNVETINIRFINLGGDFQTRNLVFNGSTTTSNADYGKSTETIHPPADSSFLSIRKSGVSDFTISRMVKFSRSINYSYFALPSPRGDSLYRAVDTVIALTTSLAMPSYSTEAYVKLFNAYPDSLITFSLMVGCPNSEPLISNIRYRQTSIPTFIRTGKVPISIIKYSQTGNELIGTYEADFVPQGQYAVVVSENQDKSIGIFILDEKNTYTSAYTPAVSIDDRFAEIRTINLSESSITSIKMPGDVITQDLQSNFIGNYSKITACATNFKDSVIILANNLTTNSFTSSFEVLEKYSIVVADSAGSIAKRSVLVPPSRVISLNGKTAVRVINLAWKLQTFDLSIASRSNPSDSLGYSAGISLAKALKYGNISGNVLINSGNLPLALFTTYSPVELLNTSLTKVEPDKEYLIIVSNDKNGNLKINLVENQQTNSAITNLEETSFIQIINSIARTSKTIVSIENSLNNAKLYYANSLGTNIQIKEQTINFNVNGNLKSLTFTPKISSRYSLILCGDKDNPDYLLMENPIKSIDVAFAERRFVNASQDLPNIWVVDNVNVKDIVPFAILAFKDYTFYDTMDKSKRYTFYFYNPENVKKILGFDIDVTLGKRYTLIFAGTNKDKFGYSVMQIQEY